MGWRKFAVATMAAVLGGMASAVPAEAATSRDVVVLNPSTRVRADLRTADLDKNVADLKRLPGYGGAWVSADGGRVVVGMTGRLSAQVVASVRAATPAGATVEVRRVRHTWQQLMNTYDTASGGKSLDVDGVAVSKVSVRVSSNTVTIDIDPASPADAEARLRLRYGSAVTVTRRDGSASGASDRTSPYPHVRGGLRIWSSATNCTAGLHFRNSLGQYYMMTAGHCGNRSWREGTSTGPLVGQTHANQWADGTTCDCAAVGPITAGQATNQIYLTSSTSTPVTATQAIIGQNVCFSGASTATNPVHCGPIVAYPTSLRYTNYNNFLVKDLVETSGSPIRPGDSGAAVYSGSKAMGIGDAWSNSDPNIWYFAPAFTALSRFSGSLLTTTP